MGNSLSPFPATIQLNIWNVKAFHSSSQLSSHHQPIRPFLYTTKPALFSSYLRMYTIRLLYFLFKETTENKMFFLSSFLLLIIIDENKLLWVIYFYIKWVRNASGWWVYMGSIVSPTHNCWQFDRTYVLPLDCYVMDNRKYLLLTGNRWKSDGRWKRTILLYWEKW